MQNPPLGNDAFDRISLLKGFQLAAAPTEFRQVTTALTVEVNAVSRTSPTSLTFEVTPGAVAVHGGRLVVIEQRLSAGEVQVRDVATGVRSDVLVGSLRGREAGPVTELFDARDEQRQRVVKELLARDGDFESHIGAASAAHMGGGIAAWKAAGLPVIALDGAR